MFYDKIWLTMREHFANTKKPRSVLTEYIVHEKVRGATASLPGAKTDVTSAFLLHSPPLGITLHFT